MLHSEKKLTLVFEYCDQDLKKYFDSCNGEIDPDIVKVCCWRHLLGVNSAQVLKLLQLIYICISNCNMQT